MKTIIAFIFLLTVTANAQRYNITIDRVTVQGVTNQLEVIEMSVNRSAALQEATGNVRRWVRQSIADTIKAYKRNLIDAQRQTEEAAAMQRSAAALQALENEQE